MATATAIINRKYQSKDGYQVGVLLINGKQQRFHKSGYKIPEKYWNADREEVSEAHPDGDIINSILESDLATAKGYFRDCRLQGIPIDLNLVFKEVRSYSFTEYLLHRAGQHRAAEQVEMYYKVERYVREFQQCFGRQDIYFSEINQDLLRTYDTWLQKEIPGETKKDTKKKNSANTRAKKFEFLGKYYNNAIDDGKATAPNPFKKYKIPTTPTKKAKLTKEQIQAIENLPLKDGPISFSRDVFLFSYYCRGIRFENCITMKKDAIINGRLYFQTNKGKHHLSVPIHAKLQAIIDRYINNDTDTIFGRVTTKDLSTAAKKRSKIGSENYMVNRNLKTVSALAEIPVELSVHHSRHTFAFHLKKVSNNIHVITQALGHSRTQVTETYLQALDDEAVDNDASKVYE